MISAVPFPQKSSRTYDLAAEMSLSLVLGRFVCDPTATVPVLDVTPGTLYRVVSMGFTANAPEDEYREAFMASPVYPIPMARLVSLPTRESIAARGLPIWGYFEGRETLIYSEPVNSNSSWGVSFSGSWDGAKLPGLSSLKLRVSLTVQELANETWLNAFNEGKF